MPHKTERPSKTEYYLNITREVAARSNCLSTNIGAIIVRDDQIISTGYNGAPRKTRDCFVTGSCLRREMNIPSGQRYELCRTVHAEQNAIINAARAGVPILNGTLYLHGVRTYGVEEPVLLDSLPCIVCKKMIINAGLKYFVGMMSDGSIKVFSVDDWAREWRERDMTEDLSRYDAGYKRSE
ncbi:MAG: deoxycytidylate deaminase [Nanobdellota archaeon]